jgi:sporulation protein YlmC with PRC-barrel domain
MLRIKRVSDVITKHVYTSEGDYFGQIEEVNLVDNKIEGWRIKVGTGAIAMFGGARGVIIPHQFVKAIGDVFIINKGSLPMRDEAMAPMDVGAGNEAEASMM